MLRTRVLTAIALLVPFVASLWAPGPVPFALLTLVFVVAAAWEWGRLNQGEGVPAWVLAALVAGIGGYALAGGVKFSLPDDAWWPAALVWGALIAVALRGGPAAWPRLPRGLRWVLGVILLLAAWMAMARARAVGVNFMMSVFALVWVADIAAYFAGRAFGRRKLAPTISPGKSWEGVAGGVLGVLALALAWTWADARFAVDSTSLYTRLAGGLGWAAALPALVLLAGASVAGDLVESLVKRAAGMKDSSRLLPGHGGVLDRIDALLPVFPIALAIASLAAPLAARP